jgi:hypothetical protein
LEVTRRSATAAEIARHVHPVSSTAS